MLDNILCRLTWRATVAWLLGIALLLAPLATTAGNGRQNQSLLGPDEIFSDGFESGDTSAWSATVPPPGDPVLDPIGDQQVDLGSVLSFTLTANDPGGDPLSFSALPLPLPAGASLDGQSGEFSFQPGSQQVGEHVLTFTVSDGALEDSETITITVDGPPPAGETGLVGRVLDANDAAQGTTTPIVGVTVSLLGTGSSTTTDANGDFTLADVPSGDQLLDLDSSTAAPAPDGSPYASFRESYFLIDGVTNVVTRPLYLPRLDMDSQTPVDPDETTLVENPNIGAILTLVPHSAKNPDGSDFDGVMTISEVPRDFAPAELPEELDPGLLITIQPVGVTFDPPAPLTLADVDGLPVGTLTDLWSLDPERGIFTVVGTGEVQDDATIDTIGGGVRAADWHAPVRRPPEKKDPKDRNNYECNGCCEPEECRTGSAVTLKTGELSEEVTLPAYVSQGQARAPSLRYSSQRAYPTQLLPIEVTIPVNQAVPPLMSYGLRVGGVDQEQVFVDTSILDENQDETFRASAFYDASDLPTGIYPAAVRATSIFPQSTISADPADRMMVVNEQDSAFGAGWGLQGLQRLHEQPDGSALLVDGDGLARRFAPVFEPNLTGWMEELNYPDGAFRPAIWEVAPDGLSVEQIEFNSQSVSTFLSPFDFFGDVIFRIRVDNDFDDDNIGFVLGYQRPVVSDSDPENDMGFILFDWKQRDQNPVCGLSPEGTRLLHVLGDIPTVDTTCLFSAHPPPPDRFRVLGEELGDGRGWKDLTDHEIRVSYQRNRIVVDIDGRRVYDVSGIFPAGRIGFYNFSQIDVIYSVRFPASNPDQLEGPPGDTTTIFRNPDSTFTRTFPDGRLVDFDAAGLMTAMTDRNGNVTTYAYDANDRLTTITDPVGLETTFSYAGGLLDSIIDPAGRTTSFSHDGQGDLVDITYPDGAMRSFAYDGYHRLISQVDRRGLETQYEYDLWSRLERSLLPDGSERLTTNVQQFGVVDTSGGLGTFDNPAPVVFPEGAASTFTDGEGRTVSMDGDLYGQAEAVTDPTGLVTQQEFSPDGLRTRVETPSGHVWTATYDDLGNRLTVTDEELSGTFTLTYEPVFQQVETITDPFANTTTLTHDANGNPTSITTPESRVDTFTYTAEGQLDTWLDRLGTTTDLTYDTSGLVMQVDQGTGPAQRTTTISRTPEGYEDLVTDPESRTFDLDYDQNGRPTSETLPDGEIVAVAWDDEDNLTSVTPPGRPAHDFTYTENGDLETYQPPAIGGAVDTTYTYNLARQLTRLDRPDGRSVLLGYDAAGRRETRQIARGTTTLTYDPTSGLVTSIAAPGGAGLALGYQGERLVEQTWTGTVAGSTSRTFDEAERIATERVNGANQATFTYDDDHLLTAAGALAITRDPASGLISGTTLGGVTDTWTYNEFGELVGYQASFDATVLYEYTLARDKLGRIVEESETVESVATEYDYAYDARGRLEQVDRDTVLAATYAYDANGNRLSRDDGVIVENGTYDDQDRVTAYGGATYAYRQSGEVLTKTDAAGTTTYDYDEVGNLLSVDRPDGVTISYVIDAGDRRIGKEIGGTLVQGLLYKDQLFPIAELDGGGSLISRFVYGTRAHVPDYLDRGSTRYRLVSDQIGSVRLVVDTATGAITQRLDYDEFGRVLLDTNPGFQPFGFAGGIYDPDTGLVRFGARDYDPLTGRWTAKDPLLFGGGSTNLYDYVGQRPLDAVDPTGLEPSFEEQRRKEAVGRKVGATAAAAQLRLLGRDPVPYHHFYYDPGEFSLRNLEITGEGYYFEDLALPNTLYTGSSPVTVKLPSGRVVEVPANSDACLYGPDLLLPAPRGGVREGEVMPMQWSTTRRSLRF